MSERPTPHLPAFDLPTTGHLAVISGPSGVGKTAIVDRLLAEFCCERLVTATSRASREGEIDGEHYHFYSNEQFEREIAAGGFLEHAVVYGNFYGTPLKGLREQLERGATVILNIDVQGATDLLDRQLPGVFVFIEPPSMSVLEQRLRSRGTEAEDVLQRRMDTAKIEMKAREKYHHRVINDKLHTAVTQVAALLEIKNRS